MTSPTAPYSRAERLLNLLMALRATRHALSRDAIRAQVRGYDPAGSQEAFLRKFERDKEDLRALGITVVTVTDGTGSVVGYRAESPGVPGDLALDRSELAVLATAARMWDHSNLAPAARNALAKLEARWGLTVPSGAWSTSTDAAPSTPTAPAVGGFPGHAAALADLVAAVGEGRSVRFEYRKPGEAGVRRRVDPWRVLWWRGAWYLLGWDLDRQAVRVFRVSRITGRVLAQGPHGAVRVPEGFDARAVIGRFAADRPGRAVVAVQPGRGASLRRAADPAASSATVAREQAGAVHRAPTAPAGWDVLEVDFAEIGPFVAHVATLAGQAVVLSPPQVRQGVRDALEGVLAAAAIPPARAGRVRAGTSAPPTSSDQFARMLALVPWLAAHDGVSVAEAAAHFGVTSEQILADLASVITSGVDDWTLFDIQYWDPNGRITMIDPLDLDKPLSLAPDELLALTVAMEALAVLPGADPAVGRVLAKLRRLAPRVETVVDVRPELPEEVVAVIAAAQRVGRTIEMDYLVAARDEVTHRTVDPIGLVVIDGYTYLVAHCRLAGAQRQFRLDRVLRAQVGPDPAVAAGGAVATSMAEQLGRSGRAGILDVAPTGARLIEALPIRTSWDLGDGWVRVELPYGEPAWLIGLALSGAGAVVVREPDDLAEAVSERARAGLALHR